MNWGTILFYVDWILFIIVAVTVLYLFVFALAAMFGRKEQIPVSPKKHRILVLFPCYKEDKVIESTINSFLEQDYPRSEFDVAVISDHMSEITNFKLAQYPIILLTPNFEKSSKANSLNYAMQHIPYKKYDIVVILDADNLVDKDFLQRINDVYAAGSKAIQAHRISKNRNTYTAILDALSEEVNNSIFRAGHVNLGFSSALIGSGMAMDYQWFKQHIGQVSTAGEDKEFEALLMEDRIYIEYLNDVYVYDEKVQKKAVFNTQRRRWMAAQMNTLGLNLKKFFPALYHRNFDLADKIFQWMMLPRSILLALIVFMGGLMPVLYAYIGMHWWMLALKWWIAFFILLLTFAIAIPNYLVDARFNKAMRQVPILGLGMILNLFRLGGLKEKFLHTDHNYDEK